MTDPAPHRRAPMRATIMERFTRAFGAPELADDKDMLWQLRTRAGHPPINVLVNGTIEYSVVWIFDPTDLQGEIVSEVVTNEATVTRLEDLIRVRVERARSPA